MGRACCCDGLQGDLELEPVTALVYGVPKLARGLPLDDKPTDEVKADQKEFFRLLYHLLVDAERGPRLPTLIVALGAERVRPLPRRLQPAQRRARDLEQRVGRGRAGVAEELRAALPLGVSPMARAASGEQREAAQEAAVGLVLPRHRAVALPAVAAQQVEAAVVADPGVGVDGHVVGARSRACSASAAQAAGDAGWRRTTSPGASPAARSASAGSAGRWVGGGPAIRST